MKDGRIEAVWKMVDILVHGAQSLLLKAQADQREMAAGRNVRHDAVVTAARPVLEIPDVESDVAWTVDVDRPVKTRAGQHGHLRRRESLVCVREKTRTRGADRLAGRKIRHGSARS